MDHLTFVATLVTALAWPLTTLILATIVLIRLPKLVRFIKAVRYKDWEVTIREDFAQARSAAEQIVAERKQIIGPEPDQEKVLRLADIDASIAVIEVWRRLEKEIVKLMQHSGLMRFTTPAKFMDHLARLGKISPRDIELFRKLRDIRNLSIHALDGRSLTKGEVLEFSNFVDLLVAKLEAIKQEPGYIDMPHQGT